MTSKKRSAGTWQVSAPSLSTQVWFLREHAKNLFEEADTLWVRHFSVSPGGAGHAEEPASCATVDQLREKAFGKAVKEGGFSEGTIKEMVRLYGVAAAPPAEPALPAGGRRRRRTLLKKREVALCGKCDSLLVGFDLTWDSDKRLQYGPCKKCGTLPGV